MLGRTAKQRRGFTLVEILMVVLILGIASAIIIPQIGSRDDLVAAAGSRVVIADLIYAQNRAIAMQSPFYIKFTGQSYSIYSAPPVVGVQPITHPVTRAPYTTTFGAQSSPLSNVALTSESFGGPSIVGFDEMGSPFSYDTGTSTATSLTASGTVVLTSGSSSLTISIEPYTGEVTVH